MMLQAETIADFGCKIFLRMQFFHVTMSLLQDRHGRKGNTVNFFVPCGYRLIANLISNTHGHKDQNYPFSRLSVGKR